jgi:hypothetical protein
MIIGMTQLVDIGPTEIEVEDYARAAYSAFAAHQRLVRRVAEPRWKYLRLDLKSFWLGQARATLSVYAFVTNPVEEA